MVHTSLHTLYAVPASPPDSVTAVNISSTAIQVSWDPVSAIDQNGVITQYEVEYNQTTFSEVSMYTTTVNSTKLMVDLTGLEEYVLYSIRVRTYTSVGAGPYSGVVMERTQEDCKLLLTLGAHAHRGLLWLSCVYVYLCMCMCVHSYLSPHTLKSQKRDTNVFIAMQGSLKMLHSKVMS